LLPGVYAKPALWLHACVLRGEKERRGEERGGGLVLEHGSM